MPTPNHDPHHYDPQQSYSKKQLSKYDMQVAGVVVFVVTMTVFFVIAVILMLFATGTVTHAQTVGGAVPSAEQKNKLAELTQPLPTPQPHPEDINDDIAVLHAREDLRLDHYSWASPGQVRIPIERAMELVAQRGLSTTPAIASGPLMTGDPSLSVAIPLTSGFAPTANEKDQLHADKLD